MTRATAQRIGVDFEEFKAARAAQIPVRRVGVPELSPPPWLSSPVKKPATSPDR